MWDVLFESTAIEVVGIECSLDTVAFAQVPFSFDAYLIE